MSRVAPLGVSAGVIGIIIWGLIGFIPKAPTALCAVLSVPAGGLALAAYVADRNANVKAKYEPSGFVLFGIVGAFIGIGGLLLWWANYG
jgi:hypothetical protein